MQQYDKFYINGAWQKALDPERVPLINPANEKLFGHVSLATQSEVDAAVIAARRAFKDFSEWTIKDRVNLIDRIMVTYERRMDEFAQAIAQSIGIPVKNRVQVTGPLEHMKVARDLLDNYAFLIRQGDTLIQREPVGVCALISPWNWPVQTEVIKSIYALAAGCTVVSKPAITAAASSVLLAEVMHDAGVPAGVFNMINGHGHIAGEALSNHADVDMISFTGSTRAGCLVGAAAARTVKKVSLELGGKSANIVLQDADLEHAARWNIQRCFFNSGQSCHAPSRMLVHESQVEIITRWLVDEANKFKLGDPLSPKTTMGPVVSKQQFDTIQRYIASGISEGAQLAMGGVERPDDFSDGYYVKPTIFTHVNPDMTIAREEIFGPVLAVIPYRDENEALAIANDSPYGLGGYVFSRDVSRGWEVARQMRAGRICFNGAPTNSVTPMGGFKQSGIGRSMGKMGLEEYLEVKSIYGFEGDIQQ